MTVHVKRIPLKYRLDMLNRGHASNIEYIAEMLMQLGEMELDQFFALNRSTADINNFYSYAGLDIRHAYSLSEASTVLYEMDDSHPYKKVSIRWLLSPFDNLRLIPRGEYEVEDDYEFEEERSDG